VGRIVRRHGVPEVVAALLVARGQQPEDAERFLDAGMLSLHDPFLLPGMETATERLLKAAREGEKILIHGDYDVDGVTGTTMLTRLLRLIGAEVEWHIPHRLTDGYSFGEHSLEAARRCGARVIVSVDNGTSAHETIAQFAAEGIDVIVTDHHEPPKGPLPEAIAIVNPKVGPNEYPFRELCGAGVAFKLAWGVCQRLSGGQRVRDEHRRFLLEATAFVAIATVCDVVPLVDENRILARRGLRALERTENPGLRALLDVCGIGRQTLVAEDVGFKVGPRINAAGRIAGARIAVDVLLAATPERARELAVQLDELNTERKRIEADVLAEALRCAEPLRDVEHHPILVVAGQGWHQGVVGIVAARLAERFARPALVIGLDGETGRGSARSVPDFSVLEVLHGGAAHMLRYGGHAQAAGCEVRADAVDDLREALCERARELLGDGGFPEARTLVDYELPLGQMTPELMRHIDRLEPFGERNEKPVLLSSSLRLAEEPRVVGATGAHLMFRVRSGETCLKAVAFGMGSRRGELRMGADLRLVYTPRWNTFRGETKLELHVVDFETRT